MAYPSIAEHGLIGDLQTAALVATDGTIALIAAALNLDEQLEDRRRLPTRPSS